MAETIFVCENSGIGDFSNDHDDGDARKLLASETTPDWPQFYNIRKRYCVALLLFLFSFLDIHATRNTWDAVRAGEFSDWTLIMRHFQMDTIGQAAACLCGCWIHRIGGATFVSVGNLGKAIVASTFYSVVKGNVYPVLVHSFTFGFLRGLSFLGSIDVLAHWAPPNERVRLATFVTLGHGLSHATYDIIQDTWRNSYHTAGFVLLSWSILWVLFVSNDPSTDRYITKLERKHLRETINFKCVREEEVGFVFRRILASLPVYVLMVQFCVSDALFMLAMALPFDLDIRGSHFGGRELWLVATLDLLPLIAKGLGAWFLDYLRCRPNGYSVDKIHKTLLLWSPLGALVFFFVAKLFSGKSVRIVCVILGKSFYSLSTISYAVILIDMAGPYAGSVKSVINSVRLASSVVLYRILTTNDYEISLVRTSLFTIFATLAFIVYGSGDLQPWARTPDAEKVSDAADNTACKTNKGGEPSSEECW